MARTQSIRKKSQLSKKKHSLHKKKGGASTLSSVSVSGKTVTLTGTNLDSNTIRTIKVTKRKGSTQLETKTISSFKKQRTQIIFDYDSDFTAGKYVFQINENEASVIYDVTPTLSNVIYDTKTKMLSVYGNNLIGQISSTITELRNIDTQQKTGIEKPFYNGYNSSFNQIKTNYEFTNSGLYSLKIVVEGVVLFMVFTYYRR